jgi:predicted nucleic acid-binding protein
MSDRAFLDTNVLIYALARNDSRATAAMALLAAGGVVSVQVLNEFVPVARRKLRMGWGDIIEAVSAVRALCTVVAPLTLATHDAAVRIAERYGFSFYDALIAAAAQLADCTLLYSEDFQDGQIIDGGLTVRNPFAAR